MKTTTKTIHQFVALLLLLQHLGGAAAFRPHKWLRSRWRIGFNGALPTKAATRTTTTQQHSLEGNDAYVGPHTINHGDDEYDESDPTNRLIQKLQELTAMENNNSSSSSSNDNSTLLFFLDRTTNAANNKMHYSLFQRGKSALRQLDDQQQAWVRQHPKPIAALLLLLVSTTTTSSSSLDAAHEVILGVNLDNIDEAERVGQMTPAGRQAYGWYEKHPLSAVDDVIHSWIHQYEAHHEGEGGHTGWDNARYWMTGGPKRLWGEEESSTTPTNETTTKLTISKEQDTETTNNEQEIWNRLARYVQQHYSYNDHKDDRIPGPLRKVLFRSSPQQRRQYSVIAGGGQHRNVTVPFYSSNMDDAPASALADDDDYETAHCCSWDPMAWIDLLESLQREEQEEHHDDNERKTLKQRVAEFQVLELLCLLDRIMETRS